MKWLLQFPTGGKTGMKRPNKGAFFLTEIDGTVPRGIALKGLKSHLSAYQGQKIMDLPSQLGTVGDFM